MEATFLKMAVDMAKEGIQDGQSPFGAIIVKNEVISVAHNTVWKSMDPTAHAEVNAIRMASEKLRSIDLSGATLYSTCEPCPMCLSAIHWAKIDCVIYGATIQDALLAGFSELEIGAKDLVRRAKSPLKVEQSKVYIEECRNLFQIWKGKTY